MKNRTLSSPILSFLVLSLVADSPLLSKADPVVSNATSSNPGTQTAPVATTVGIAGAPAPTPKHTVSYTVVKGDSLTGIAQKFNTTRKKLKKLNNLTAGTVKPGQVLLVPFFKHARSATAVQTAQAKPQHEYPLAQPVQDFDTPALTFAPRPVPPPSEDKDTDSSAPVAKLVSPAELAAIQAQESTAPAPPTPQVAEKETEITPSNSTKHYEKALPVYSIESVTSYPPAFNPPASQPAHRSLAEILGFRSPSTTLANDWANRFLREARALANEGIEYDEDWRPPGESHSWEMDCSNTARYLYKVTTGIELPRTASDQYYYLHLQGKAWDAPQTADGWADTNFLRHNLKPGDLLFWENTYRPERQPPITHVMVFLGTNEKGQWIMAGSQTSRGGEHNRRNGGPDIYVFRPSQPCGGYTTWLGLVHHQGRFCAFGRPLEADPSKLAVAENN